jgi:hypothetical protein
VWSGAWGVLRRVSLRARATHAANDVRLLRRTWPVLQLPPQTQQPSAVDARAIVSGVATIARTSGDTPVAVAAAIPCSGGRGSSLSSSGVRLRILCAGRAASVSRRGEIAIRRSRVICGGASPVLPRRRRRIAGTAGIFQGKYQKAVWSGVLLSRQRCRPLTTAVSRARDASPEGVSRRARTHDPRTWRGHC